MLTQDPDEDCRSMAAEGLGSMFQGTLDPGILTALARAALEDPLEYVRDSAYLGLLRVNESPLGAGFRFIDAGTVQVDPQHVREILRRITLPN
jgi:hypothetical protein